VARLYEDFLDVMVIDNVDAALKPEIEALAVPAGGQGLDVVVTDTIMASMEKKAALARAVLSAAGAR
jgi:LPPG:FO 2-phospho-L-lactate transferase